MAIKNDRNFVEALTNPEGVASFHVLNDHTYTFLPIKTDYMGVPTDILFTWENHNSLKEVKLFMSSSSKASHMI